MLKAAGMQPRPIEMSDLAALGVSNRGLPDVAVFDLRAGQGLPAALGPFKRQHSALGVVIVASTSDPELLLEAMRAGVNEFVPDPFSQVDLERAISRVLGQRTGTERGKILGFVGAKGGVGTTTVAVNVAASLSRLGREARTLLIDMHQAGGDDAVFLGVEPKFSILDVIENTHRLDEAYLSGVVTQLAVGFDLLASSDRGFAGQLDSAKLRSVLDFVSQRYKYVVLDLPRSDAAVLDSLDHATAIFIVANQELATVKSATRMASTLRQRFGRDKIKVILSRSDRQADIGMSDVERAVGAQIAHSFPSDYRVALQALNKGRPVVFEGESNLAESFSKFVAKLTDERTDMKETPVRGGLFSRLTQSRRA